MPAQEFLDTRADDLLRRAAGAYAWQSVPSQRARDVHPRIVLEKSPT